MRKILNILTLILVSYISSFAQDTKVFGEGFESKNVLQAKNIKEVNISDESVVQVAGVVKEVCQAAGCWMTIELDNGEKMRVTFKDYGFFVPKDLAGTKVTFKGIPELTETSVAELKHFASDAGKSSSEISAITEPEIAITFVASGVLVPEN